ncbi:CTD kinase subunit gamma CTK3-domain-containing protein [Mrakia frigida]|uniref:CTD kinase subunit gamma CTK3-domain-containing protein n=1 Tax=Mrakia frigida TaxID=29902 RepID=UPI003FCC022E
MSSSFDPFDIRMQLLSHLSKLNASQQSIQKVVQFTIKYGARCGEDLWDCIIEECEKGTLNVRINVLFLLDSLCETSLYVGLPDAPYVDYVTRDLSKIVELVVPESREGVLNLLSAKQILESWRTKRVINPELVDHVLETLEKRKATAHVASSNSRKRAHYENFSHADTLRRMEEDRERQKRLRERIWILPIPHLLPSSSNPSSSRRQSASYSSSRFPSTPSTDPSPESPFTPASPFTPKTPRELALGSSGSGKDKGERERAREREKVGVMESALDIEFEQVWETTSELNEDDLREMEEENSACFDPPIRPETLVDDPATKPPSPPTPLLPTPLPSHSSRNPLTSSASASSSKLSSPKIVASSIEKNASRPLPSQLSNEISRTHSAPPLHPSAPTPPPSAPSNPYSRSSHHEQQQQHQQQRPPLPSPNPISNQSPFPPPPPTLNPTQNYGFPPPPLAPPPTLSRNLSQSQPNYSLPPPTFPPSSSSPYPAYPPPPPTLFQPPPPTLPLQSWQQPSGPPPPFPPPGFSLHPPLPPHMLPPPPQQQQPQAYDPSAFPPYPPPPPQPTLSTAMVPPPGTPTGPGSYSRPPLAGTRGYERSGGAGAGDGYGQGYQRGRGR